jgi:hypothetical protein
MCKETFTLTGPLRNFKVSHGENLSSDDAKKSLLEKITLYIIQLSVSISCVSTSVPDPYP